MTIPLFVGTRIQNAGALFVGQYSAVALLIGEGGAWSFVSLDPDTTQECLGELELPPATGCSD